MARPPSPRCWPSSASRSVHRYRGSPAQIRHLVGTLAQADDPLVVAADIARELSRLEAARDFDALYDRMHPDAQAVMPRAAMIGWYESFFSDKETALMPRPEQAG